VWYGIAMIKAPVKSNNITPTKRQRLAVKNISEHLTKGGVLESAGYSKSVSESPSLVMKSKGFIVAMEEMGITDEFLNKALMSDITTKKGNRLGELTLAYKLKGKLTDTKQGDKTLIINVTQESANRFKATESATETATQLPADTPIHEHLDN